MTSSFSSIYSSFTTKIPTHWLGLIGGNLSYVPKQNAQAERQQAFYLSCSCRWGFGVYGFFTLARAIEKSANQEIDQLINLSAADLQTMQQQSYVLQDVQQVVGFFQRQHQIQKIDHQQRELIQKVEQRLCSHYGLLRRSSILFAWRVTRFVMNIPNTIRNLFDQKAWARATCKKMDLQQEFKRLITFYPGFHSIWSAVNNGQQISLYGAVSPECNMLYIEKEKQKYLQVSFWIDRQALQTKYTEFHSDEEAKAIAHRFFASIASKHQLTLPQLSAPSLHGFSYTQITVQNDNELQCVNALIEGAHQMGKLSHLFSITTILEAAKSIHAQNG